MVNNYIKRKLESNVTQLSKKYPIITILGPRQSGKTTLLREMFPEYHYITLESPDIRIAVQNDPRGFLDQHKTHNIIIDEFQRIPELTSYLQEYADTCYKTGQVFLTGSQQYNIFEKVSQSLAGRTAILKLLPLSLAEIISSYPLTTPEIMMVRGSYPAIYDRNMSPQEWYPSYVETYLERDVRQIINMANLDKFMLFLNILAGRAGQLLNMNNVGIEVGVSQPTAKQWLSILQASQLTFMLQPFHKNLNKRIIKTPKLYFTDTGLLCYLLGVRSEKDLRTHPLRSSVFENHVISEFYKFNHTMIKSNINLLFYRDKSGREVDLIIEQANNYDLFEIKYTRTIRSDHFKQMSFLSKNLQTNHSSVIYAGNQQLPNVIRWEELQNIGSLISE